MEPTTRPRIKICCIGSVEEAKQSIRYGASALGLVSEMSNGSSLVSEGLIAQVASMVPPGVSSFLLTSKSDTLAIVAQQRRLGVNAIQICDRLQYGTHGDLRQALPGIAIVQSISITGEESIKEALFIAPHVSALVLNSNDSSETQELGDTEQLHNWEISKRIRELVDVPVFLAGGLTPDNVADAIQTVQPFGVDVCSGVRTQGQLDESKLSQFFSQVYASADSA
ncbi:MULTISPECIES: phosphoribosylanthranilate isomerase [unclassified Coleofasciculus]|uniref:phosphoribosylanthranilate isomerase n=1 Tax=unclassified Coleofasciculus TaxID=2692782 RepID=UPI0018805447|nr:MULTISPECIES: phosphoribosylanthranilate isomerase [unclassified Coleofasciculus]MBE9125213.1 phosphoribosylanthranilate isomerase [Coleofasciculus sp. LEGE 07081]MBE9152267.1 phosphoribosylanthranilate isomerase [Coleofasciculus sp. LEGE 07092]